MKWFRLYSEVLDDPKLEKLSDSEFRDFVYLMCLACEMEKDGSIPLSLEDISWRLRRDHVTLCNAIETLVKRYIVTQNGDGIRFINWNKRQFKRDNSTERVRRYRDKKKHETPCNGFMKHHVTPLEQNRDRDRAETDPPIIPQKGMICPHREIVSEYHKTLPELPQIKKWTSQLQVHLQKRWKEDEERQNIQWWNAYFLFIRESAFLMGMKTDFRADFEWLIRPTNMTKVLNGRYHHSISDDNKKFGGIIEWMKEKESSSDSES